MARARLGVYSQPEEDVVSVHPASRSDHLRSQGTAPGVDGFGPWYGHLRCGHGILRLRRPKVGQIVVCWVCAKEKR